MLTEYIQAALDRAHHGLIEDEEPFYGEVDGLRRASQERRRQIELSH